MSSGSISVSTFDPRKRSQSRTMNPIFRVVSGSQRWRLKRSHRSAGSVSESVVALALAEAIDGPEAVLSAAFAASGQMMLEVSGANIMGVPVPVIEQKSVARGPLGRGYSFPGVSSRIDRAAEAFEVQVDLIIELATSEMRLRRLAVEIGRTTRRVNALDNVLIPRLEEERNYVEMVLEERAREDLFRLKRVKVKLQRQRTGRA